MALYRSYFYCHLYAGDTALPSTAHKDPDDTGETARVTEPASGHTRFEPGKFGINSQQFLMSRPLPIWAQHETMAKLGSGLTCLILVGDVAP